MISDINDPSPNKAEDSRKDASKDAQAGRSTVGSTSVSAANFYGKKATTSGAANVQSNSNTQSGVNVQSNVNMQRNANVQSNLNGPPPLPKRDQTAGAGSSHTMYAPPGSTFTDSTYREPELVADDDMPELMPAHDNGGAGSHSGLSGWPRTENWTSGNSTWASGGGSWPSTFDSHWDQPNFTSNTQLTPATWLRTEDRDSFNDGNDTLEERLWWDPAMKKGRPGYGMLAPRLVDMLHNPDLYDSHSLFLTTHHLTGASVSVNGGALAHTQPRRFPCAPSP